MIEKTSRKLNLGCGRNIKKGYVNIDRARNNGVDVIWNLEKFPYPFEDKEFNEIYARYILEHLEDFGKVMKELHRILKPKGKLIILVPHFSSKSAYSCFHKTFFKYNDFNIFLKGVDMDSGDYNPLFSNVKTHIKFDGGFLFWNYLIEFLININNKTKDFYETCFSGIFPAHIIEAVLIK